MYCSELSDSFIITIDKPNKYHCPDEPIKYNHPPGPSMDDGRSAIKRNIQYLERLQINQEDCWKPIKACIE